MKKVKTVEEAFVARGLDPVVMPDFSMLPEKYRQPLEDHFKLIIVVEAINDGWEPNWNDDDQEKYYPWLQVEASDEVPGGFGFSHASTYCGYSSTDVGSRLVLETHEAAIYVYETFPELYKSYFLIAKK
jgi:hypothetical protein